jgi:predicted nucleotidyltransferase
MIEKLFTSRNRVKLLGYFFFREGSARLREISKKIGIPVSGVSRELNNLVKLGIVKKNKDLFLLNRECNFLDDLKNIFVKTDYIVYPIKKVLESRKIKFAFVFGSFARGEYNADSDVDLMILGDIKLSEVYEVLKSAEKETGREINPVVWTIENLEKEKNKGFVRDIFRKGIIVLKGDENEIRKIAGVK